MYVCIAKCIEAYSQQILVCLGVWAPPLPGRQHAHGYPTWDGDVKEGLEHVDALLSGGVTYHPAPFGEVDAPLDTLRTLPVASFLPTGRRPSGPGCSSNTDNVWSIPTLLDRSTFSLCCLCRPVLWGEHSGFLVCLLNCAFYISIKTVETVAGCG